MYKSNAKLKTKYKRWKSTQQNKSKTQRETTTQC